MSDFYYGLCLGAGIVWFLHWPFWGKLWQAFNRKLDEWANIS